MKVYKTIRVDNEVKMRIDNLIKIKKKEYSKNRENILSNIELKLCDDIFNGYSINLNIKVTIGSVLDYLLYKYKNSSNLWFHFVENDKERIHTPRIHLSKENFELLEELSFTNKLTINSIIKVLIEKEFTIIKLKK